jgi:dienelactone hydrolase
MVARKFLLTLVVSIGCALAPFAVATSHADSPPPKTNAQRNADAATVTCGDGLSAIAEDACFSAPIGSKPAPLLLYLHGLYQPDAMREELDRQARVAKHAVARGYAVLALYGRMGICDTRGDHLDWMCWPSNEQVASRAAEVVASWKEPLARARQRAGNGRTYVLGFSNGAYFAGLLAVRDLFSANAYAIAQGGPVEPVHALGHRAPILLLSTTEETPQVHAEMDRFGAELAADGWSFVQEERTGWHELNDQDIDAALDFFDDPSPNALH